MPAGCANALRTSRRDDEPKPDKPEPKMDRWEHGGKWPRMNANERGFFRKLTAGLIVVKPLFIRVSSQVETFSEQIRMNSVAKALTT